MKQSYIWHCDKCGGCRNGLKLKPCLNCKDGVYRRYNWPPRPTKANKAIKAMSDWMFGRNQSKLGNQFFLTGNTANESWARVEGYFIHKFKLRGKELKKFVELSQEWGGRSLT